MRGCRRCCVVVAATGGSVRTAVRTSGGTVGDGLRVRPRRDRDELSVRYPILYAISDKAQVADAGSRCVVPSLWQHTEYRTKYRCPDDLRRQHFSIGQRTENVRLVRDGDPAADCALAGSGSKRERSGLRQGSCSRSYCLFAIGATRPTRTWHRLVELERVWLIGAEPDAECGRPGSSRLFQPDRNDRTLLYRWSTLTDQCPRRQSPFRSRLRDWKTACLLRCRRTAQLPSLP